jgi:hypothetical protein
MHNCSEIKATLELGVTSIHNLPVEKGLNKNKMFD